MSLNQFFVEDAALAWCREPVMQSREIGRVSQVAPGEAVAERGSIFELVHSRCARTLISAFSLANKDVREVIRN